MRYLLALIICCIASPVALVHANDDFLNTAQSISERTHDQACFVDHVNVITGTFEYSPVDFVIPGPKPIAIQRSISSFSVGRTNHAMISFACVTFISMTMKIC